jgi:hypothetical protein
MPAGSPPDDELGERLGRALHADLAQPVDVPRLIEGSRSRARQIRHRRIGLATAGVVMLVAVPLGAELISSPDAEGPSAVLSSGQPNPRTSRTIAPLPSPRTGAVPYRLPDTLAFRAAELPREVELTPPDRGSAGQNTGLPLVNGQTCRSITPADPLPLSTRQWIWSDPGTGGRDLRITLTVTAWDRGEGATAFSDLVTGTGRCTFSSPQEVTTTALYPGVQSWLGTGPGSGPGTGSPPGSSSSRVVVRHGDLIAGIEVHGATGAVSAQNLSRVLGGIAAQRITASGLG